MIGWRWLAMATLAGLAGCGGLETPDLAHGAVEGRVVGASADGYAYPLGVPGLAARVRADGSFRIDRVPAGEVKLLVFDDTRPDGTRRAEVVDLTVPGGGVARLERNGERAPVDPAHMMAPAGSIVATVALGGGAIPESPRFAVEGTDLVATALPGRGAVELGQLPAATGLYRLSAAEDGYLPGALVIDVASATNAYDLSLEIDVDGPGPHGCGAVGGGCLNALTCDAGSGSCVQCLGDADCPLGSSCDLAEHFCSAPAGGPVPGGVCTSCSVDAQCLGAAPTPARCDLAPLATSGSCTWAPLADSDCPSGFTFLPDAAGQKRCVPAVSCAAYFATFGQGCLTDEACRRDGAIVDGLCHGADKELGQVGYCTAACQVLGAAPLVDSCVVPGYACDPVQRLCLRT